MSEMLRNNNSKEQLLEEVLKSPCPEVIGDGQSFQGLLDDAVSNKVNERLSSPESKYRHAIRHSHEAGFYTEDLLKVQRPENSQEYFEAVASINGFGATYDQYQKYMSGQMPRAQAVAFGKYFRRSAKEYESILRASITPEDMENYLRNKISRHVKEDFLKTIGRFCDEAIDLFDDESKISRYVKALASVLLSDLEISREKIARFKEALYLSIAENVSLLFFLPHCLRYYYDKNGEQQIIGHVNDFEFTSMSGRRRQMCGESTEKELVHSIVFPLTLTQLEIPTKTIVLLMDDELLKLEQMDTGTNHQKAKRYLSELMQLVGDFGRQRNVDVTAESSLGLFGIPSVQQEFQEITNFVRMRSGGRYGVTNNEFIKAIDRAHERHNRGGEYADERSQYYRSREFATLLCTYVVGQTYTHGIKMAEYGRVKSFAGTLIKLPKRAEFDSKIFNLSDELIVYS